MKTQNLEGTAGTPESRRALSRAVGLGTDLLAGTVIFTMGGYWLDQRRGTGAFWTVCGMILAFVYGGYEVWKVVRSIDVGEERRQGRKNE
jgi:F0F1-type ATP synthase assembly protein I